MTAWVAIVMAAGAGSRMHSRRPKVLHEVAGKPMLRRVVGAVAAAGIARIVVVLAPGAEEERRLLPEAVVAATQAQQRGTADAVRAAQEACAGAGQILVLNGDLPLIRPETLRSLCAEHEGAGAAASLLTAATDEKAGLARVRRGAAGRVEAIVEERDADPTTLALDEINAGVYCFQAAALWPRLASVQPSPVTGELYLTEVVNRLARFGATVWASPTEFDEVRGVNTRAELATAERIARIRACARLMEGGVTILDPATTYVDEDVQVAQDTVIHPNTHLCSDTTIGETCEIGPNSVIRSSRIGSGCRVLASVVEESTLEDGVSIGPFSHLRDGAYIESGAYLGNYAEVKKSRIGGGTQMHHFSYAGDAMVGRNVNIGAGMITCNYDGKNKHPTTIGDGAFIGSDTMLVAPVTVGAGARTGAGSVVTRDVPSGGLVLGVPAKPRVRPAAEPGSVSAHGEPLEPHSLPSGP